MTASKEAAKRVQDILAAPLKKLGLSPHEPFHSKEVSQARPADYASEKVLASGVWC